MSARRSSEATYFPARYAVKETRAVLGKPGIVLANVANISASGLFAEAKSVIATPGDEIEMQWSQHGGGLVTARGVVVWTRKETAGKLSGFGLRFRNVTPEFPPIVARQAPSRE
jgi:hypothetical protein